MARGNLIIFTIFCSAVAIGITILDKRVAVRCLPRYFQRRLVRGARDNQCVWSVDREVVDRRDGDG